MDISLNAQEVILLQDALEELDMSNAKVEGWKKLRANYLSAMGKLKALVTPIDIDLSEDDISYYLRGGVVYARDVSSCNLNLESLSARDQRLKTLYFVVMWRIRGGKPCEEWTKSFYDYGSARSLGESWVLAGNQTIPHGYRVDEVKSKDD